MTIIDLCKNAKAAEAAMRRLTGEQKNQILLAVSDALLNEQDKIIAENQKDLEAGKKNSLSPALLDRLTLNEKRIRGMAESLQVIAAFPDPIGEISDEFHLDNGLKIQKVRSPLGVIAIIYESRPNVTIDSAALCLKASNISILRGSASAIHSNKYLTDLFNRIGKVHGLPDNAVQLVEDTSREAFNELVRQDQYIDVLIPRGGQGLKKAIKENASIPIIMTGAGTCHIFIDESADQEKAIPIILNAKVQRPGVCNAVECLLIHQKMLPFAEQIIDSLVENQVRIHLSRELQERLQAQNPKLLGKYGDLLLSDDQDELFGHEFLAKEILLHVVDSVDQAIQFINQYGTHHSDAILTEKAEHAEKFLNEVDSAVVYVNASTRFSDGGEFGFGGEIGISTQKLHARGPMGIKQLTSERYIVHGSGQIRA